MGESRFRFTLVAGAAAILWLAVSCLPAHAQPQVAAADAAPSPRPAPDPLLAALTERIKKLEDAAKKRAGTRPTVNWTAQLQADGYAFSQSAANRAAVGDIENGLAFRRARFGLAGEYGPTDYRVDMDFALAGRPTFLDVFAGVRGIPYLGRVQVGHFFEPFGLERVTRNRHVTFMERSLPDQPFFPSRNLGVMANDTWGEAERGTWAVGVFASDSDVFGDSVGDDFRSAITGRVTGLAVDRTACETPTFLHLGVGYTARATAGGTARFRSQPEARVGAATPNVPNFVDTGAIPSDFFQEVGLEAAWVDGPFSLQGEYVVVPVQVNGGGNVVFESWYATASLFLTGESRPYTRSTGTFGRVIPKRDAISLDGESGTRFGPGAWEVAVRLSQLDLNDGMVEGGRLTDVTLGLNWYLNPHLRVTANYVHAMLRDGGAADIFAMRVGYEF